MSRERIFSTIISILLMVGAGYLLTRSFDYWTGTLVYLFYAALTAYFFLLLVSNQAVEEDAAAKTERIAGSILVGYILFIQMIYAPLANVFFHTLLEQKFFLSDVLALILFLFFVFLFVMTTMVLNSWSRFGFLSDWELFNSRTAYFVLRVFWPSAVLLAVFLFLLKPFIIITV